MKLRDKIINISRWDSYSGIIIIIAVMFSLMKWRLLPIFVDIYYHLLTATGFQEAGGWVGNCFWECAPIGRPQLYPPFLHIILLFLLNLGIPIMVIGKLAQCIMYPLVLFAIWYVTRELFGKRYAFFALVMLFSVYSYYLTTINTLAASLSLVFGFLSLLCFERNKRIAAALLLALSFYTHGVTPWLFLAAFVLYGIFNKYMFFSSIKICLLSLFFASPIILYQFFMRDYFLLPGNIAENKFLVIDIFPWSLCLFGIYACFRKKARYYVLVALFFSFVFLLGSGLVFRYFSFYGVLSAVLLGSVFLDKIYDKLSMRRKRLFMILFFVGVFVFSPTLNFNLRETDEMAAFPNPYDKQSGILLFQRGIFTFNLLDSSLSNFIFYCRCIKRSYETTIYFPHVFKELQEVITNYSHRDDIIYSNFPYTGGILALLSQRATSSAMLSEIKPFQPFDRIAVSKLVVWQKDPRDMKLEPIFLIKKYQLNKVADTALAFVYENPWCRAKKKTISATIGYKTLFFLLFLLCVAIIWSAKFSIDKNQKNVIL